MINVNDSTQWRQSPTFKVMASVAWRLLFALFHNFVPGFCSFVAQFYQLRAMACHSRFGAPDSPPFLRQSAVSVRKAQHSAVQCCKIWNVVSQLASLYFILLKLFAFMPHFNTFNLQPSSHILLTTKPFPTRIWWRWKVKKVKIKNGLTPETESRSLIIGLHFSSV